MSKQTNNKSQQISFIGKILASRGATMFFIIEKSEETTFEFCKDLIKIETQKTANLLNSSENEYSKLATEKWYVIDSEAKGNYSHHDPIKFLTKSIESSLCDYSDAYILVTEDIAVKRRNADNTADTALHAATKVAFKNCAPFKDCRTEINDTFDDYTDFINIAMPMYNLIEYSDNYSDSSGSLWILKEMR